MSADHQSPAATWQHLHRFAESGCEASFRALFDSHAGLVFHAALRAGRGDRGLAEDVVQTVFLSLARKARTLSPSVILPAWLHRHACLTTGQMMRASRRREARERASAALPGPDAHRPPVALAELVDEALDSLPDHDRAALALRFLENKDLRAVGRELGVSDDTAQKRVSRGLDRLRAALERRGVKTSAAVAAGLLADSASAFVPVLVPPAVAAAVSSSAGLAAIFTMKTTLIAAASLLVLAGVAAVPVLRRQSPAAPAASAPVVAARPPAPAPAKPRVGVPVTPGPRLPAVPAAAQPRRASDDDAALKAAFQAHPKTKIAEKRVNDMKSVAKELLDRLHTRYRDTINKWKELEKTAGDLNLTAAERAAVKAESDKLVEEGHRLELEMDDFRKDREAALQKNVAESRAAILAEIKNPSPPAPRPTPAESTSFNAAEGRFLKGDYAAAEAAFTTLAASAAVEVATFSQWKVMLCRMIQGADNEAQMQPLLQGDTSSACYAMAARAIQRGGWDEAGIWIHQAQTSGDSKANALFSDPLIDLGWMDAKTGLLIPPEKEHQ